MKALLRAAGQVLRLLATPFIALFVLFEEWGWEPLARLVARLNRIAWWARVERWIARLPPYPALLLFALPAVALFPLKLLALYGIAHGHAVLGVGVIVVAKIAGTAMVARLFQITQPSLMRLPWFARLYTRWKAFKDDLLVKVRASWPWRASRVFKRQVKAAAQRAWARLRSLLN